MPFTLKGRKPSTEPGSHTFSIERAKNGEFYGQLTAGNGEVVWNTLPETYKRRAGVHNAFFVLKDAVDSEFFKDAEGTPSMHFVDNSRKR